MKLFSLNNLSHLHDGESIFFCKKDYTDNLWRYLNNSKRENFIVISGNSDYPVTHRDIELFNRLPEFRGWYGQNMSVISDKTYGLPLGLENSNPCNLEGHGDIIYGAKDKLCHFDLDYPNPNKLVYCNFGLSTNRNRSKVLDLAKKGNHISVESNMTLQSYYASISNHKMVICPEGNGVDTHRFWETIYLNRVPIIIENDTMSHFYSLPVVVLDSWERILDIDYLNDKYNIVKNNSRDIAYTNFWIEKIKNHKRRIV